MKKLLLTLVFACVGLSLNAQTSGGPDLYGYTWKDSNDPNGPAFNWIDIRNDSNTIQIGGLADDNIVGPFQLPAPFQFYWYTVDKFKVGSNGYISFGTTSFASYAHPFPTIPFADSKDNVLAPFMTDLSFDNTGAQEANPASCYYWVSPGQDSVIITYDSVPFWDITVPAYSGENTFQIILDYNDSSITYQYNTQSGVSPSLANFVSTGIENISGTDGLQVYFNLYAPSQYAIKFTAPQTTSQQINDGAAVYNNAPGTGGVFISRNASGSFPLNTQIRNSGNTTLNPFNVNVQVISSTNVIQLNNTVQSDTLQPGDTQDILFANPFIPANAGTFRFITTTSAPADAAPGNNGKTMEINVVDTTLASILLAYDNGVSTTTGISWSGGNGGLANYFVPPFYPADITSVSAYILNNPNLVGYTMRIFDDNGPNGSAGTQIDSISVPLGAITPPNWVNSTLPAPIRIDSGGFYVMWDMGGDGITLGTNTAVPISYRSFEILSGVMAEYRSRETEDLMIRATISRVGVGVEETAANGGVGQFYPNPGKDLSYLNIDPTVVQGGQVQLQVFNMNGQLISNERVPVSGNRIAVNTTGFSTGLYTVRLLTGNLEVSRKLNIIR
jgi:hypothetical protein